MLAVALLPALLAIPGSRLTGQAQAPTYLWHEDHPPDHPGAGRQFGMAEDPARHQIVLFGGHLASSASDIWEGDTWVWDEAQGTWSKRAPIHHPPDFFQNDIALAYDGRNIVAYGELSPPAGSANDSCHSYQFETWLWDGSDWRRAVSYSWDAPGPPGPRSHSGTQFAYDPRGGGSALLFGGAQNCDYSGNHGGCLCAYDETWSWNGRTESWTRMPKTPSDPPGTFYGAMAYDGHGEVVLFGNEFGHSGPIPRVTYGWAGTTWVRHYPTVAPTGNYAPSMAYDPTIDQIVLFGGASAAVALDQPKGETWSWSGLTHVWTLRSGVPVPPTPRSFANMATSSASAGVLLFGGLGPPKTPPDLSDTWESGLPVGSTTTTLSSSVNPSTLGQPVAFTARVTPAVPSRPPAGNVIFQDGTSQLGAATLDGNSTASLTTSTLALGGHTIAAAYTGDNEHLPSLSAPLLQGVVTSGGSSAPTVSQVAPSCGPVGVPVPATLRGSRLWNASVSIPGWRSTDARADLPGTSLTVTLPAHPAGPVSLTVATAAGSALASFNYTSSCIPPTATPSPAPSPPPSPTLARARGTEHALRSGGLGTSGPAGGPPTSSGTPAGPGGSPASAGSPLSVSLPVVQPGAIPGSAGLTNPGVIPGHGDEERPEAARAEADVHAMVGWDSAMAPGGAGVAVLSCATLGRAAAMRRRRSWRPCPRQA